MQTITLKVTLLFYNVLKTLPRLTAIHREQHLDP